MATVENLRNKLIEKILTIRSKSFLEALDVLISHGEQEQPSDNFNAAQIEMLKMGLADLENENTISQEELDRIDEEWLNEK